jgi:hypothetical protein
MEEKLLYLYNNMLSDLLIGYPIDNNVLNKMISLIHQLHFVNFSSDSKTTLKILERYA